MQESPPILWLAVGEHISEPSSYRLKKIHLSAFNERLIESSLRETYYLRRVLAYTGCIDWGASYSLLFYLTQEVQNKNLERLYQNENNEDVGDLTSDLFPTCLSKLPFIAIAFVAKYQSNGSNSGDNYQKIWNDSKALEQLTSTCEKLISMRDTLWRVINDANNRRPPWIHIFGQEDWSLIDKTHSSSSSPCWKCHPFYKKTLNRRRRQNDEKNVSEFKQLLTPKKKGRRPKTATEAPSTTSSQRLSKETTIKKYTKKPRRQEEEEEEEEFDDGQELEEDYGDDSEGIEDVYDSDDIGNEDIDSNDDDLI
jgi:hypothetical protein